MTETTFTTTTTNTTTTGIILFYKYHPLSSKEEHVELYRTALERLCESLTLTGRILVGCNEHQSEGINGTLGGSKQHLRSFVRALVGPTDTEPSSTAIPQDEDNDDDDHDDDLDDNDEIFIQRFWSDCQQFYQLANCSPLTMEESEFKWSTVNEETSLFPDLNIKLVKELIGTGGVLASIPLEDVHKGYLTPHEWHERIQQLQTQKPDDTILIDCRNTKECQIGHFPGAIDPGTTTFNQFTQWVKDHPSTLSNKKVLMYCTGGIRCEKASAFIRNQVPSVQEVRHLKGGIHKYLETFGNNNDHSSLWQGKNFVFDGRGAHGPHVGDVQDVDSASSNSHAHTTNSSETVVGTCRYCSAPYDSFDPHCVCTVCREPTLVCRQCQESQMYREYHCKSHKHLQSCYFTNLEPYSVTQLEEQLQALQKLVSDIAVGKKFKQRRKTLLKQCDKIQGLLQVLEQHKQQTIDPSSSFSELKCRNCGQVGCSGRCWGFHSLKRKLVLEEQQQQKQQSRKEKTTEEPNANRVSHNDQAKQNKKQNRRKENSKREKERQKQHQIEEWKNLGLTRPPWAGRDVESGIRIPSPCTRILETNTKGKWCGQSLWKVLQTEFTDLADNSTLERLLHHGLIRVNGDPVFTAEQAETMRLKNMDVISRVVHWHEPPVHLPTERIGVQKVQLAKDLFVTDTDDDDADPCSSNDGQYTLFVINKPSSVPVHPAGPYLSNSLTILVEAQEGLSPRSLIPCHRIDRVTSGMTLCCTNVQVARLVQSTIDEGSASGRVRKQYLARVHGKFPTCDSENLNISPLPTCNDLAQWKWVPNGQEEDSLLLKMSLQVDAPIETVDPANGIRQITKKGRPSTSQFQLLQFEPESNTSIISCIPVTGRSHQLRVHLQWLGHSIVNDVQYGGITDLTMAFADSDSVNGIDAQMVDSIKRGESEPLSLDSLGPADIAAARKVCPTCTMGLSSSFTPAQLLQGGHAICLHAYRYSLTLARKRNKNGSSDSTKEIQGRQQKTNGADIRHTVHLTADLPIWASNLEL